MRAGAAASLVAASALAGAGGLAAESILLARVGLAAGQSVAGAYGIGAYVAGWAVGAWIAGRVASSSKRSLALAAVLVPLAAFGCAAGLTGLASGWAGSGSAVLALAMLAVAAVPQGLLLPWIARGFAARAPSASVVPVFAANLLGALAGAWWIGFELVSAVGRPAALASACGASVAAALVAAAASPEHGAPESAAEPEADEGLGRSRAGALVALVTLWSLGVEWACLRIAVLWIGSQAFDLTLVIAISMLALALGAALLPQVLPKGGRGVVALLAIAAVASTWPVWAAPVLARAAAHGDVATALALVVPSLAPFGAFVPMLHRAGSGESGRRLGRLLGFELFGALAAGPLLHGALVPRLGIGGALGALCASAAIGALIAGTRGASRARVGVAVLVAAFAGVSASWAREPARAGPKLTDPSLSLVEFREDQHFAVAVVDDGVRGERTLLTDQFRAAGTGREYRYMRALGHLPLLLHREPRRAAVVALGTGTTLGAVALHERVERIDVLEISKAVVDFAPSFEGVNGGVLTPASRDPRIEVAVDDGRRTLARRAGAYDVIGIEPLLPDSPFGVYLYTPEFYSVAREALAPGGLFCQWVPPHALEPEVFDAVIEAFADSFPWASAWLAGTQVLLVGGDERPGLGPERFAGGPKLAAALAELGLADPDSLRARFVAELSGWPDSPRGLRDSDPWIAWKRKSEGPESLAWLARNLERLCAHATPPPWPAERADGGRTRLAEHLREARIAHAWCEVEVRAGTLDPAGARSRALAPLEPYAREARDDAEVRAFVEEVEFLHALRTGVAKLRAGTAEAALDPLLRAAELRPERADVHGYVSAALRLAGHARPAEVAWQRALELCPRFASTPEGRRATSLSTAALEIP